MHSIPIDSSTPVHPSSIISIDSASPVARLEENGSLLKKMIIDRHKQIAKNNQGTRTHSNPAYYSPIRMHE